MRCHSSFPLPCCAQLCYCHCLSLLVGTSVYKDPLRLVEEGIRQIISQLAFVLFPVLACIHIVPFRPISVRQHPSHTHTLPTLGLLDHAHPSSHSYITLKLSNTTRNLPDFPKGERIASKSPLTLVSVELGAKGADIAATAARHWEVICTRSGVQRNQVRLMHLLATRGLK